MKTIHIAICLAVVALPVGLRAQDRWDAGIEIRSVQDFYEPLAEHGYWQQIEPYGWCWSPANVAADWQPYANGYWLWTDGGWYWASDEPWAWACYHYGSWVEHAYYGWIWVPGTEWAPAWVAWREGDGYVGWAPVPPAGGYLQVEPAVIAPAAFIFVEERYLCRPIRRPVICRDRSVFNRTRNITQSRRVNHVVINEGPAQRRGAPAANVRDLCQSERRQTSTRVERQRAPVSIRPAVTPERDRHREMVPVAETPRRNQPRETRQAEPSRSTPRPEKQSLIESAPRRESTPPVTNERVQRLSRQDSDRRSSSRRSRGN